MNRRGLVRVLWVAAVLAGCADGTGLRGTAVVVQDVEGLGDQELESGWVVAVPASNAHDVWPGGAAPPDDELPYASAPLARTSVEAAGGAVGVIDDGEFTLDAPAGEHLLCLVQDDGEGEEAGGCGYADLPSSGRLDVTTGEAGFRVAVGS